MIQDLKYPATFPDKEETIFLKLVLSKDEDFTDLWYKWKENIIFDDIDYATLRLLPTLYSRLKNFDISDDTTGRIKGVYKLAWFTNQTLINALKKLGAIFNNHDIPVVLLKGIPLLLEVYKDVGSRSLGDADILIDPKYALEVVDIMLNNGWKYIPLNPSLNSKRDFVLTSINRIIHATTFENEKGLQIDIHWNVFHVTDKWNKFQLLSLQEFSPKIYNKEHFEHSVDILVGDTKLKMLCIEDMLIHVIAHAALWGPSRNLRWVVDCYYIINNFNLNWDLLIDHVKMFDLNIELYFAISYLLNNFDMKISDEIIKQISKLELDKKKLQHYFEINQEPKPTVFGNNIPFAWYTYWKFEPKEPIPLKLFNFTNYLVKTWGLNSKKEIPSFLFNKYKKVFERYYEEAIK